ncbi:amidohydrolase family protein [Paenarthrobacter nicotinovorans]|uniref:amidohydrolase family protein n=1 Tax=Paenarthrobacter nicotinovorans TaxID=29320 RepID=UPI0004BCD26D|nr:amidohydrolase family protein [Paenarthrobacter nicotinovorans]
MAKATTIVNARVFDGTTLQEWTSVRFEGGLITNCSVEPANRDGDDVIDAAGGTLLPGLIDTHVHIVPGAMAQSLTFGVTTVLDMFSKPDLIAVNKEQASSHANVADLRSSGIGATASGGHPSLIYAPFPTLDSPDEAEKFVAERLVEGADYLKVFSGVGGLWPSLNSQTIKALVSAAHKRGLLVVAHVSSTNGVEEVVSAGIDVLAHIPVDADLDSGLIERIAASGIAVTPTLATVENTLGEAGGAAVAADPRLAAALGDEWVLRLNSVPPVISGRTLPPYSRAVENVRRLAEAGVLLLAGTDAPNPGTVFGASLHRELELLVQCGLDPAQALTAATSEPARVFGLNDRGRVEAGRRADLVLLSGDPLLDITATRSIERIWRGGTPCDRSAFVASPAEKEQLAAFDTQIAKAVAAVRERRTKFASKGGSRT